MTRSSWLILCLTATVPLLSGCGTFFNCLGADKAGPRTEQNFGKIYGGVRFECEAAESVAIRDKTIETVPETLLEACLLAVDMPLSAIGDTLTLPFTISYTLQCQALSREQQADWPDPIPVSESREIRRQDEEQ